MDSFPLKMLLMFSFLVKHCEETFLLFLNVIFFSMFFLWLEMNKPPIAKITGIVVITLPTDTAELDGSKSSDDKGIVSYLWTRDEGSPAAGVSVPGGGELQGPDDKMWGEG